ncbi:hypothetical protein EZV62_003543 [Acer yangbiense]|uniref:Peptidase S8/S53 domain-containing protein n=1 Tax=Acer yangbiense TaxID=1000413 RepID=A0A5C7IHL9_9ROSI|nr:hypothetical protein EZV62_003543 [Acer yangbiense]
MSCMASVPVSHPLNYLQSRNLRHILPHTQSLLAGCSPPTAPSFLDYNVNLAYRPLLHLVKVLSSELLIQESGKSESFSGKGMSPIPQRWNGKCENGTTFSPSACNRKLIGAKSFSKGFQAAEKSAATDVLAGMDQAIADGVDILSLSLGFNQTAYFKDVIAIASLSAIEKGIFVVCAAGNDGSLFSTYYGAPWIATVGAATLDWSFTATMTLENGLELEGISYFPESIYITDASLYYGRDNVSKAMCKASALDQNEVAGKVVLCDNSTKIDVSDQMEEVERAGAYTGIFLVDISDLQPDDFIIPSLILDTASGTLVRKYVTEDSKAKVKGMRFTLAKLGPKPAPQVAFFSSRGPDPINPGVLNPDILAPGVDVLAAVTPIRPFIKIGKYKLVTDYALDSGTSMATPHVAEVAALLKAVHKEWSPAAIRSAIMTTAYTIDNTGSILKDQSTGLPATPLDFGAGHINANRAMDPGLVYDMDVQDYIEFLCGLGYDEKQMKSILRRSQWNCSQEPIDLNYPSFMAIFNNETVRKFSRVVTNVGDEEAVYHANLKLPTGMKITIEPSTLTFTGKYQKQNFVLSIETDEEAPAAYPNELSISIVSSRDDYEHTSRKGNSSASSIFKKINYGEKNGIKREMGLNFCFRRNYSEEEREYFTVSDGELDVDYSVVGDHLSFDQCNAILKRLEKCSHSKTLRLF